MDHHAYLLIGERSAAEAYLENLFSELGIVRMGNPDIHFLEFEVFSVDDARLLSRRAEAKAFGDRKIFAIFAARFTPEAQNALLKTLEEPRADTHFFISTRQERLFLPTLLSRMRSVRLEETSDAEGAREAAAFFQMSPAGRIAFARKFADEKDERGAASLGSFLDALLLVLKKEQASLAALKKVLTLRGFADDPAAAARLILEHLALVLP